MLVITIDGFGWMTKVLDAVSLTQLAELDTIFKVYVPADKLLISKVNEPEVTAGCAVDSNSVWPTI